MARKKHQHYTEEFRKEVVRRLDAPHPSDVDIAEGGKGTR